MSLAPGLPASVLWVSAGIIAWSQCLLWFFVLVIVHKNSFSCNSESLLNEFYGAESLVRYHVGTQAPNNIKKTHLRSFYHLCFLATLAQYIYGMLCWQSSLEWRSSMQCWQHRGTDGQDMENVSSFSSSLVLKHVCLIAIYKLEYSSEEIFILKKHTEEHFQNQEKWINNTCWEIKLLSQLESRTLPWPTIWMVCGFTQVLWGRDS